MSTLVPPDIRQRVIHCARVVTDNCADAVGLRAAALPLTEWLQQAPDEQDLYLRAAALDQYPTCLSITPPEHRLTPLEFLRAGQVLYAYFTEAA
jgi:hypothetical protein